MPTLTAKFYLASNPDKNSLPLNVHSFSISSFSMDVLGILYSGTLIDSLGYHYNLYTSPTSSPMYKVWRTTSGITAGRIKMQDKKHKAAAVTGNIGEVLIIPSLASTLGQPMNALAFHRIKAHNWQCPDYRVSFSPSELNLLWPSSPFISVPMSTSDFPLEVKSCLHEDNYYPIEALQQLYHYWKGCSSKSVEGYGIIARVNIRPVNSYIRFYIFVPNKKFKLELFKKIAYMKAGKKKVRGVTISNQQRITRAIGRLFY